MENPNTRATSTLSLNRGNQFMKKIKITLWWKMHKSFLIVSQKLTVKKVKTKNNLMDILVFLEVQSKISKM